MAQVTPTVKVDFKSRVIAFDNGREAIEERDRWMQDTPQTARVLERKGVYNVIVSERRGIDAVMHQFIVWGGPVIKRHEALKQAREQGFTDDELQFIVFAREEVEPPEDPAFHRAVAMKAQENMLGRPTEVQL